MLGPFLKESAFGPLLMGGPEGTPRRSTRPGSLQLEKARPGGWGEDHGLWQGPQQLEGQEAEMVKTKILP